MFHFSAGISIRSSLRRNFNGVAAFTISVKILLQMFRFGGMLEIALKGLAARVKTPNGLNIMGVLLLLSSPSIRAAYQISSAVYYDVYAIGSLVKTREKYNFMQRCDKLQLLNTSH
jgi:hypothetical protein